LSEIEREFKIAEECLEEAKNLFSSGYYRGSVSRAYYSMYHAAKALLLTKNISPKTHAGVLRMLGLEFVNKNLLESSTARHFSMRSPSEMRQIIHPTQTLVGRGPRT